MNWIKIDKKKIGQKSYSDSILGVPCSLSGLVLFTREIYKKVSQIFFLIPLDLRNYRSFAGLNRLYSRKKILDRSPYKNIYHCCTQKTASQWFKKIFSDPIVYQYTGLEVFPFESLFDQLQNTFKDQSLPKYVTIPPLLYKEYPIHPAPPICTISSPLYISYLTYLSLSRKQKHKTFFVLRDPRDIVISWYFSVKYSHGSIGLISTFRDDLEKLSLAEGLCYSIDKLEERGIFFGQRSWMNISEDKENIRIFRYEDLVFDNRSFLRQLFDYLNIVIPEKRFLELYERYKFEKLSGGRKQGVTEINSHYRKGVAGDWMNYFDNAIMTHFRQVTGDLLEVLGYSE